MVDKFQKSGTLFDVFSAPVSNLKEALNQYSIFANKLPELILLLEWLKEMGLGIKDEVNANFTMIVEHDALMQIQRAMAMVLGKSSQPFSTKQSAVNKAKKAVTTAVASVMAAEPSAIKMEKRPFWKSKEDTVEMTRVSKLTQTRRKENRALTLYYQMQIRNRFKPFHGVVDHISQGLNRKSSFKILTDVAFALKELRQYSSSSPFGKIVIIANVLPIIRKLAEDKATEILFENIVPSRRELVRQALVALNIDMRTALADSDMDERSLHLVMGKITNNVGLVVDFLGPVLTIVQEGAIGAPPYLVARAMSLIGELSKKIDANVLSVEDGVLQEVMTPKLKVELEQGLTMLTEFTFGTLYKKDTQIVDPREITIREFDLTQDNFPHALDVIQMLADPIIPLLTSLQRYAHQDSALFARSHSLLLEMDSLTRIIDEFRVKTKRMAP